MIQSLFPYSDFILFPVVHRQRTPDPENRFDNPGFTRPHFWPIRMSADRYLFEVLNARTGSACPRSWLHRCLRLVQGPVGNRYIMKIGGSNQHWIGTLYQRWAELSRWLYQHLKVVHSWVNCWQAQRLTTPSEILNIYTFIKGLVSIENQQRVYYINA
jgi:hypothetical protein